MSGARYVLQSLLHHWRMNLAVALGVAVGTAVLTGALLVGDSMRGSLQHLALDRLSRVELALISDHFFRARLATELVAEKNYPKTLEPPALINGSGTPTAGSNVIFMPMLAKA